MRTPADRDGGRIRTQLNHDLPKTDQGRRGQAQADEPRDEKRRSVLALLADQVEAKEDERDVPGVVPGRRMTHELPHTV